ncbi:MAG: hypothetical protein ACRDL5_06685, partial [Solirubrobacteraceae bacterium]
APGCSVIAVMVLANAAVVSPTPANGNVSIWVWLGASMLLAAARGYGGCEVLAASNLIGGRRDEIGCILYTPIDRFEAARTATEITAPPLGEAPAEMSAAGAISPLRAAVSGRARRAPRSRATSQSARTGDRTGPSGR